MYLDVTDANAMPAAGGGGHLAAATTAAGNNDFDALNRFNSLTVPNLITNANGSQIRIWDEGTSTTLETVDINDEIVGLYFPAGQYAVSQSLGLREGYTYVGRAANDANPANNSVILSPSLFLEDDENIDFAFSIDQDDIAVNRLQFEGPGITGQTASSRSGIDISNNAFTGEFITPSTFPNAYADSITFTLPLTNSVIEDNDFFDLTGEAVHGVQLYHPHTISVSNNRFWNVGIGIHTNSYSSNSPDIDIDSNVGQRIRAKLIECNGNDPANLELRVTDNKVSDFIMIDDSTFGISVSITPASPDEVLISGNEISDIGTLANEVNGVRIGIEVGGITGATVENNIIYGMEKAIALDNAHNTVVQFNVLRHYTNGEVISQGSNWRGVSIVGGSTGTVLTNQTDYNPDLVASTAVTVAFDRIVTGGSGADTFTVASNGSINSGVLGSIPTTGPVPGRVAIYGFGNGDTITVDPGVNARVVVSGGFGTGSPAASGASGNDTISAGAGAEHIFGADGNDYITLDMTNASLFPDSITAIDAGSGSDTFKLFGSTNGADTITLNTSTIAVTEIDDETIDTTINKYGIENIIFDGKKGFDTLTISGGPLVNFPESQEFHSLSLGNSTSAKLGDNGNRVLLTRAITVGTGAKLDLTDNGMIVDYTGGTPFETIRLKIKDAYNTAGSGNWEGTGITSTTAMAVFDDTEDDHKTGLGFNEATELAGELNDTFFGVSVDATAVLIRYTYYGDIDLNAKVDVADLGILATNWQDPGYWPIGDFDHSGTVDVNDLGLIATNWQQGVPNYNGPTFNEAWDELT
jgi:hypothetical protein